MKSLLTAECATCVFSVPVDGSFWCHRLPPDVAGMWPPVLAVDWCGGYVKLGEEDDSGRAAEKTD